MHLLQHFKELTVRPKNAQELKGLILQLAVQGKLTKKWRGENPAVEPASVLLKKIQSKKTQLIEDKKIRKDKELPVISNDKIPFVIPNSWEWCRLQDYLDVRDGTHDTPKYVDNGIPLVTSKNLYTKRLDLSNIKFISEKDHFEISKRSNVEMNDILFAMIGSIGNPVIVDIEPNFSIKNVALIKYYIKELSVPHFILFFLEYATQEFKDDSDGAVQSFVSLTKLRMKEFPLPPLEEQKAIVAIVETLFKEVEQLEQLTVERITLKEKFVVSALNQLTTNNTKKEWGVIQEHFHTFFNETNNIKKLRETVLQLAVQGKLTGDCRANNTNFENASVLLNRIQKEKAQLIKDKKIKNETPLPAITKDEIPYELPNGWVWCRIDSIKANKKGALKAGPFGSSLKKEFYVEKGYKIYGQEQVIADNPNIGDYYIDEKRFESLRSCEVKPGDILISLVGTVGKVLILPEDIIPGIINPRLIKISLHDSIVKEYFKLFLYSPYLRNFIDENSQGSTMNIINLSILKQISIPLPPQSEQKAIVEKVTSLMGLCDALEKEVNHSQEQSEKLMQSALREVFETNNAF